MNVAVTTDALDPHMLIDPEFHVSCAACGLVGTYDRPHKAREALDAHRAEHASGALTYRVALRPDDDGNLDDVVVRDVGMFRAEDMGETWWLCCYLNGEDEDNRLTFSFDKRTGDLFVTEFPQGVMYEAGSLRG